MRRHMTMWVILGMAITVAGVEATAQSKPAGQLVIAVDTAIAPSYLDPAEAPGRPSRLCFSTPSWTR